MQDFFENVFRYPRYLISLILGIFFAFFEGLKPLFQNRVSMVALIGIMVAGFIFLFFTLEAMLGLKTL